MDNRPNHPLRRTAENGPHADRADDSALLTSQAMIADPRLLDESTFEDAQAALGDVGTAADADDFALRPWGDAGPAPVGSWRTDVLGEDFESRTIPLESDAEGDVVTTLIRLRPRKSKGADFAATWNRIFGATSRPPFVADTSARFVLLYIHGRNDYFFHAETAQVMSDMGAAFYAVDLRKHGRSLRPWQTIGYVEDLSTYDEDIAAAMEVIRQEHPDLPVYIMAHSTGGLIATLWAWRHPDDLAGLILNSAWLELQIHTNVRAGIHAVAKRVAHVRPRAAIVGVPKSDGYYRSLANGWATSGFPLPTYFGPDSVDPAYVGWKIHPEWKRPMSYPAPAAWVVAILDGHELVEKEVHLQCPVLAMASTGFAPDEAWTTDLFNKDVVLDADIITQRAARISDSVTIARFPGKHDLLLSDPPVRQQIYKTIQRWLDFIAPDETD